MVKRRLFNCSETALARSAGAAASLPVTSSAKPLPVCADSRHPLGGPGVFEVIRRWIDVSRALREATTIESRVRVLMQHAFGAPVDKNPSKVALPQSLDVQRAAGLGSAESGALETEPAQKAAPFIARSSSGVTLFDAWRRVPGCAAEAALLSRSLSGGPPCGAFSLAALGPSRLLRRCDLLDVLPESRIRGFRGALELISLSTCDLLQQCTTCDEVLPLAKGHSDLDAAGGTSVELAGISASVYKPGCAGTESPTTATAVATATVPAASMTPTAFREDGDAPSVGLQGSTRDLADSFTHPAKCSETHLQRHVDTAVLMKRSRAALPLGDGVGPEVHVLVSGGVDSAVSLLLMREWGFRPKPVFLKVWAPEAAQLKDQLHSQPHQGTLAVAAAAAAAAVACPWREDAASATAVAAAAGLPLEVLPMQQQYWDRVITTFLEGARAGLTLNPDWSCNSLVKFGAFAEAVGDPDSPIVSGHYARIQLDGGAPRLLRGRDLTKDQSYFLSGLSLQQLSRSLFPVGALLKTEVRKLAADLRLPSSQRPDSQGLCFLGPLPVGRFLTHLLGEKEGPVYHFPSGALVGSHKGLWAFTAGQQKGVLPLLDPHLCRRCRGAAGGPPTLSGPWSVVGKVPEANALFVVSKEEERAAEDCVRTMARLWGTNDSRGGHGDLVLKAAAEGDRRAILALKLRQLRTCLRVENIRWFRGEAPPEFAASIATQEMSVHTVDSVAAAVAASAVAAAKQGASALVGKLPNEPLEGDTNENGGLVVQVRHSAGFHAVAKHKFKILWASRGSRQGPSGSSSRFSVPHEDAELLLEEPDVGLAPGQIAAFYRGDECIGSARISALQGLHLLKDILDKGN
ncbi:tRNA methyltransferase domain-containing protein, putative [Eimeria brunetti]|uniref:tRNA-5-taurinomethyluridine 2-sulfurtransferase n=1 Tax=Eimeria brunetti TaxID=51314 RepID=U6LK42_9EIME|nr:tRNA methyltransferase domain-containing protein, putative [Eimeria brunetti]